MSERLKWAFILTPTFGVFAVGYCLWETMKDGMPLGLAVLLVGMLLGVSVIILGLARGMWPAKKRVKENNDNVD